MSGHTPGRLKQRTGYPMDIVGPDEHYAFARAMRVTTPENAEANARRLVACWNAFEGVPTEKFEGESVTEYITNEAYITGVSDGRMGMAGESAQVLIHAFVGVFVGVGAENYLELSFTHPGTGPFQITMQKTTGKTPHECRKDAEAQRDELLADMRRIAELGNKLDFDAVMFASAAIAKAEGGAV